MIDLFSFFDVFFRPKEVNPHLEASHDFLYEDGLTMGTLYIGRQGSGKTSSLAGNIFEYFKDHPQEAIFVLDWSGSITDNLLTLILQDKECEKLLKRVVYDEMGNPEWVIPLPEFSEEYGEYEEQVQRVSNNLSRLAPELVKFTPVVGGLALADTAPNFFRLLTSITNEYKECWQITETKRLIYDLPLLKKALNVYGNKCPSTKMWMQNSYLESKEQDRNIKTYSVIAMLGAVEPNEIKARVGYYRPGWTPREAIQKGLMVLCDGARLINRSNVQHYLFTQVYSLIMQEINKRRPADPRDKPVSLVMDEVYSLLKIPSMAPEISQLSPQYRSRKLQLYIVLQELAQMSDDLRPHIWSLGNVVCFGLNNHEEAYEMAQQLFKYEPYHVKVAPVREGQNPIMEPDRGQYLQIANWIQSLEHRQCIMRRYVSERVRQEKIQYVHKTYDNPTNKPKMGIVEAKERLLRERGIRVRDALEVIAKREIIYEKPKGEPPSL